MLDINMTLLILCEHQSFKINKGPPPPEETTGKGGGLNKSIFRVIFYGKVQLTDLSIKKECYGERNGLGTSISN